ncbi:class I SAM-dependent methyltransferase [Candidatus Woesearchaeota archaeon]|nr:class I SAM-dependent methyltransferase [Candidatus Woesearchaeota archaeon]
MSLKEFKNNLLNTPLLFNLVRSILVGGKKRMYNEIRNAVNAQSGDKILDIGCGTGEFAFLFNNSIDYTGIDMNKDFLDYASSVYKNKKFILMDATKMSFKKNEFDIVLLLSFMHHFPEDLLDKILKEVNRVGKRIVILDPLPRKYNPLSRLFYALDRGDFIRKKEEQLRILSKYLNIENYKEFKTGLYTLSIIKCSKK